MIIRSILKEVKIKNSDTDTYASLRFDIDLKGVDFNKLIAMKHKDLQMELTNGR